MSNTYQPAQGSLAYRVGLAVLAESQPLAEATIAASEKKSTAFVSSVLADAVSAGWLTRRRDEARGIVYGRGPKLSHEALDAVGSGQMPPPRNPSEPAPLREVARLQDATDALARLSSPAVDAPRKKAGVPRGTKPSVLPPIDVSALRVTLAPKVDGHTRKSGETKWGPMFDRLAAISIVGDQLPTVELDGVYGKAVQAAARVYCQRAGGRVKLRVSITKSKCYVQRIA